MYSKMKDFKCPLCEISLEAQEKILFCNACRLFVGHVDKFEDSFSSLFHRKNIERRRDVKRIYQDAEKEHADKVFALALAILTPVVFASIFLL
ncbi:hypothetical protein A2Z53_01090 [Candidatus Giovannonibacteria bacterium RIFCSPHIGHO2_02_42_15]|uniref:Uncharacterized protein n=2 Tax=Candidatus Giovannoniibacteriota TaxID=1752738 RepID=A0A1F5VJY9_9BACT|nr:MAG: hypothetical protein A2Z53_01090 [Candidatus Giovannonibacteria bacterium RIFCSPHIGHO2_02_42_15]